MNGTLRPTSILCALTLLITAVNTSSAQNSAALHPGESVVPASQAPADAPMRRRAGDPWIELSNARTEGGGIAVDYKFVTGGPSSFAIVVKGTRGRSVFSNPWGTSKEGTLTCSGFGAGGFGPNVEIWAETDSWGGFGSRVGRKLSRSIAIGSVGQMTMPREWTPEEIQLDLKAEEEAKLMAAPPPAPPAGYVVTSNRTPLIPGMPVLGTWRGKWVEAEVISVSPQHVFIHSKGIGGKSVFPESFDRVAVSQATLDQGKANPSAFTPSIVTVPGGSTPVPDDLVLLPRKVKLGKGVPLRAEWAGRWEPVTATGNWEGDKVPIEWDNWKNWFESIDGAKLLIDKDDLEKLKTPDGLAAFKAEAKENSRISGRNRTPFGARDYPITLRVPNGYVKLPEDLLVPEGTMLGAEWGRSWHDLKVLDDSDEGAVYVNWDGTQGLRNEELNRSSLVIKATTLKKLQTAAAKAAPIATTSKEPISSKPAATSTPAPSAAGGGGYELVLESVGTKKIPVSKAVMEITGLTLKDAIDLSEALPISIKSGLTKDEGERLKSKITAAGGTASVKVGGN